MAEQTEVSILIKAVNQASAQIEQVNNSLKGMTDSSTKTGKSLELTGLKVVSMGFALRAMLPSMSDWSRLLDGNVSGLDKLTGSLGGLNSGLGMLAIRYATSATQMIGWTAVLEVGFGLINYGIGKLQEYQAQQSTTEALTKAMTDSTWYLSENNRKLADRYVAQTEALGNLSEQQKAAVQNIKDTLAYYQAYEAQMGLAQVFGLTTGEENETYKQQQAIMKYMGETGKSWEQAVADLQTMQTQAYASWKQRDDAQQAEKKRYDELVRSIEVYNLNLEAQIKLTQELTGAIERQSVLSKELYPVSGFDYKNQTDLGWYIYHAWKEGKGGRSPEAGEIEGMLERGWGRGLGLAGSPEDLIRAVQGYVPSTLNIYVAGEKVGQVLLPSMGEAVNQRVQLGG